MQIQNTVQRYRGTRDVCHTSCTLLAFLSEGLQYLDAPLENFFLDYLEVQPELQQIRNDHNPTYTT